MIDIKETLKHEGTRKWQDVVCNYAQASHYSKALDIGTGGGISAYSIATSGHGLIVSVGVHTKTSAEQLAEQHGYKDRITFLDMTSDEFFKNNTDTFDFISVDGSHEYEDVLKDLENAWSVLNQGGYMVCDDYGHPKLKKQVGKAIDEWAKKLNLKFEVKNDKAVFYKKYE